MKKEDLTTRLLKLFFHIQGPFDECRQEMIYKACARALIQIVYSSLLLFLFYLLFGRFIELVREAMPYLYFGLIFVLSSRARLAVRNLHLDKDDQSEIHHKSYSKSQIKVVTTAMEITAGTKIPETRSATFAMGALVAAASLTIWMIWERVVSSPTRVARQVRNPD